MCGQSTPRYSVQIVQVANIMMTMVLSFSGAGMVGFTFKGEVLNNNALVTTEDIGTGDDALRCMTDNTSCCRRPYTASLEQGALGNWWFPNGTRIPSSGVQWDMYRTRGHMVVLLHRRRGSMDGVYGCVVPDKEGNDQSVYIGVYEEGAGEWYMHTSTYVAKS